MRGKFMYSPWRVVEALRHSLCTGVMSIVSFICPPVSSTYSCAISSHLKWASLAMRNHMRSTHEKRFLLPFFHRSFMRLSTSCALIFLVLVSSIMLCLTFWTHSSVKLNVRIRKRNFLVLYVVHVVPFTYSFAVVIVVAFFYCNTGFLF